MVGANLKGKQGKDTKFYEKELRDPSFVYIFFGNTTQKGPGLMVDLNSGPSCFEVTMLTAVTLSSFEWSLHVLPTSV